MGSVLFTGLTLKKNGGQLVVANEGQTWLLGLPSHFNVGPITIGLVELVVRATQIEFTT